MKKKTQTSKNAAKPEYCSSVFTLCEWALISCSVVTGVFVVRARDLWHHRGSGKSVHGCAKGTAEMNEMNVPVGASNFEKIRKNGYYYIDKSGLIGELLSNTGTKATVITRPQRFGKTLGMSVLESFFDIRKDSRKLFAGLEITENQALCDEWMNRYPTISISFRQVDGLNFMDAYQQLVYEIALLYQNHRYLLDSQAISKQEKALFQQISDRKAEKTDVLRSIQFLTLLLNKHYNKKVILLIDEYDVPVAKANSNGYYDEMLDVMKGLMIPSMPALQSLRQSTRKPWKIWRVSAKRLCSKLMIGCTQKSTRMAMIRFFATAFRSSKNAAW